MIELYILLLFMIVGAIIAIEVKDLLSSVVAVGAVGLGLSMVFLLLKAPDVAITQLVVEILCLIILIRATLNRDMPLSDTGRAGWNAVAAAIFIGVFLLLSMKGVQELPEFGQPVMRVAREYIQEGLASTGAGNLVGSIILDFRAYDTLGEATVLFAAVIGVLTVMRRVGRRKETGEKGSDE